MSNLFEGNAPLTPLSLTQRPYSVRNNNQNNNKELQPLESNSYKIDQKIDYFSPNNMQNKTFYKEGKQSNIHPLDFYTLGKIPSNTVYSNLEWNNGIKSTSNDIITRNALSINTQKYNKIDIHKKISNIYEQNITENNYLEPINIYKTYEKYKLPKYATNIGMYKLMREKYFSKDIHSPIKQGKCLSQKEFIKEKEKLAKAENINIETINSNRTKRSEKSKQSEEIKEITKSSSHNTGLIYKDPNDYTKRELKNNTFYFDKNNNQMLQQKKWIFENKK
jgi:hypothetical protein